MKARGNRLTNEQKQLAFRLRARGWTFDAIAREVGCSMGMVHVMVSQQRCRTAPNIQWTPRSGNLTIEERESILIGLHRGDSLAFIARALGRPTSTVSREVARNGGRAGYSAWSAHEHAQRQARRPKPCKLRAGRLHAEVSRGLKRWWSPDEISRRLVVDFPDDPEMRVSHETIYQSLFVQGRGELRRELARCLRSGRTTRLSRDRPARRGRMSDLVTIAERPAEVEDRAVPGHWEGDLIMGPASRGAVGTLVERSSRYVMLLHLGDDKSAPAVELNRPGYSGDSPAWERGWNHGQEAVRTDEVSV